MNANSGGLDRLGRGGTVLLFLFTTSAHPDPFASGGATEHRAAQRGNMTEESPTADTTEPGTDPTASHEAEAPAEGFAALGLNDALLATLKKLGYEQPSPIQAATIPLLLSGKDMVGMAQTGTGKTAAFALPILAQLDLRKKVPQALVLAPTRELALQVAEAFKQYAARMKSFHVLPIYGGQDYSIQLRALDRGPHVIVATPGRIMDHLRRGSVNLDSVKTVVLDEADEMLNMGFLEDVEWILEKVARPRQVVLFSATMPPAIKRIAKKHLDNLEEVRIASKTATASNIEQSYWFVRGVHKLDAITRILEVDPFDGVLIFVRTKVITQELADRLAARGHSAAAINGDMNQSARERVIGQFKKGKIDLLVATDVAARGIDVDRISHVINFDIPYDPEAYVHRIGRTGRAGRSGKAITFVTPREKRLLYSIERATRQRIEEMELPGSEEVTARRVANFKEQLVEVLQRPNLDFFTALVDEIAAEQETTPSQVGAALAFLQQRERPLQVADVRQGPRQPERPARSRDDRGPAPRRPASPRSERPERPARPARSDRGASEQPQIRYRLEVGEEHGARVADIVGAITNEAGIDNRHIGRVKIFGDHSTVLLPEGMPSEIFDHLRKVTVRKQTLQISELGPGDERMNSTPFHSGPKSGGKRPPSRGPRKPHKSGPKRRY